MSAVTMTAESTSDGAIVTLLGKHPADVAHVRALGLIGALSEGMHHQMHHWGATARDIRASMHSNGKRLLIAGVLRLHHDWSKSRS
jgi:hypothetical protein